MTMKDNLRDVRKLTLELMQDVGGGHYGGNLSEIDILTVLYDYVMKIDPKNPDWEDRDRFVLSKGHGGYGLYAVLAHRGFFPYEKVARPDQNGVYVSKHASKKVPGVDVSTGSLGQGLSIAVGMALGIKGAGKPQKVYVMMGDGELDEGQIWEAAMCAAKYKLNNLIGIVDYNNLTFDGTDEEIMPLQPIAKRWADFGWHAVETDGHDPEALIKAFQTCSAVNDKPSVIIAYTVKGKGVSFMENVATWHAGEMKNEQYCQALREVEES